MSFQNYSILSNPANTDTEGTIKSVCIKWLEFRENVKAFISKGQIKLSVIMKVSAAGFLLSFKVDSYDVNIGGLGTDCWRQFQGFTLPLYPIYQQIWLKPPSSLFFSPLPGHNENPVSVERGLTVLSALRHTTHPYFIWKGWWLFTCRYSAISKTCITLLSQVTLKM